MPSNRETKRRLEKLEETLLKPAQTGSIAARPGETTTYNGHIYKLRGWFVDPDFGKRIPEIQRPLLTRAQWLELHGPGSEGRNVVRDPLWPPHSWDGSGNMRFHGELWL